MYKKIFFSLGMVLVLSVVMVRSQPARAAT
jgi:hypothetical protein